MNANRIIMLGVLREKADEDGGASGGGAME